MLELGCEIVGIAPVPNSEPLINSRIHIGPSAWGIGKTNRILFSPRLSPDEHYIAALSLDQKRLMLFDRARQHWTTLANNGAGDPVWSSDSRSIFFQNFLEPGDPIYRLDLTASVPTGPAQKIATLADLFNAEALDYRLMTLAPGNQPVISAQGYTVNIYSLDLK
jgi:hypothetical protein